jgi:two-component system response regulator ChvI
LAGEAQRPGGNVPRIERKVEVDETEDRPIRIALVDDDDLFRETLSDSLRSARFDVVACATGEEALSFLLNEGDCDVVLLDLRLPDMTGIDVVSALQQAEISVPVIMLTAFGDDRYEERALKVGATDFVDKSRPLPIIVGRIRSAAKRRAPPSHAAAAEAAVEVGDLRLRPEFCRAYWKEQRVHLTLTEYRIVHCLAARADCDVSYREIYDVVHRTGFVAGDGEAGLRTNVRSLIKRIRKKFCAIDPDFSAIESYPGFGYRWRIAREEDLRAAGQPAPYDCAV